MADLDKLTLATPQDVADTLAFALRRSGRKRMHDADEYMARIAAERLVRALEESGFVVMKKPVAFGGGATLRRGAEGRWNCPTRHPWRTNGQDTSPASANCTGRTGRSRSCSPPKSRTGCGENNTKTSELDEMAARSARPSPRSDAANRHIPTPNYARRSHDRRDRLDALALARQQQPRTVILQRSRPVHVTEHLSQTLDILDKTRFAHRALSSILARRDPIKRITRISKLSTERIWKNC